MKKMRNFDKEEVIKETRIEEKKNAGWTCHLKVLDKIEYLEGRIGENKRIVMNCHVGFDKT